MRELQAIVEIYEKTTHSDQRVALATVVKTDGSTYRCPGARMLVTQDGYSVETISGVFLEQDVIVRVQQTTVTGESILVKGDTTSYSFSHQHKNFFI